MPFGRAVKNAFLIYQADGPTFEQESHFSRHLTLDFGMCWIDDINRPVLSFEISLVEGEEGWSAVYQGARDYMYWSATQEEVDYFMQQQPRVLELVDDLNAAIANQSEFSLEHYINAWEQFDREFDLSVMWMFSNLPLEPVTQVEQPERPDLFSEQPRVPPAPLSKATCIILVIGLTFVAMMLFDSSSLINLQQVTSMPALGLVGLGLLLAAAAAAAMSFPKKS